MPELPEVHTTIMSLHRDGIIGRRIYDAGVEWARCVGGDAAGFIHSVQGRCIRDLQRRGKYILAGLDPDGWLLIHLRMSGRLLLHRGDVGPYVRAWLLLDDDRRLCLYTPRRFARMQFSAAYPDPLRRLGPEPLAAAFRVEHLQQALSGTRRALKTVLLDQHRIAGIGNIYADEALHAAGLHPLRDPGSLNAAELDRLHAGIQTVLQRGIANLGTSLGHGAANFSLPGGEAGRNQEDIRVFRRTGQPCLVCGTAIQRIIVGQRSTHLCPRCQS